MTNLFCSRRKQINFLPDASGGDGMNIMWYNKKIFSFYSEFLAQNF